MLITQSGSSCQWTRYVNKCEASFENSSFRDTNKRLVDEEMKPSIFTKLQQTANVPWLSNATKCIIYAFILFGQWLCVTHVWDYLVRGRVWCLLWSWMMLSHSIMCSRWLLISMAPSCLCLVVSQCVCEGSAFSGFERRSSRNRWWCSV